jgi:hypothetical protein
MLKVLFRRAARLAAPCACAWLVWAPAHAGEPQAAEAAAPFKHYQGWRDEPLQDWRRANQRVGEVGGWRTYLRETQPAGDDAGQRRQNEGGHHGH